MKKQLTTISVIVGLILCTLGGYIGYKTHKDTLDKDFSNLNQRIDELFHGKDVIQDGHSVDLQGTDNKYGYQLRAGGFIIYKLSKESGGFVKSILSPADIEWLKGKYEYDSWGYKSSTYRPDPDEAYKKAFNFLMHGSEKQPNYSYSPEKLTEIKDFPGSFNADYYYINKAEHPTETYFDKKVNWHFTYDTYKLQYDESKEFFGIQLDNDKAHILMLTDSGIGIGSGLLLTIIFYYLFKIFMPDTGLGETIFNKKWKNIENNSIVTIEPKLFGKNEVTLVENEKINRGIAKITDNGQSIHLSFADAEIFYRLKTVSDQKLEMENLASNNIVKFELLGSNAYKQSDGENSSIDSTNSEVNNNENT